MCDGNVKGNLLRDKKEYVRWGLGWQRGFINQGKKRYIFQPPGAREPLSIQEDINDTYKYCEETIHFYNK